MAHKKNISVLSKFENVVQVCLAAREFYQGNGVGDETCNSVEMVLTEALNNVIEHAYEKRENEKIEVFLGYEGNKISITIADYGKPRTNTTKVELSFDPDDIENLPERGMGLFLIENLMDETNYETKDGKNIYKLEKTVSTE